MSKQPVDQADNAANSADSQPQMPLVAHLAELRTRFNQAMKREDFRQILDDYGKEDSLCPYS